MNTGNPAVKAIYESPYSQTELAEEFGCSLWHFNRVVNRHRKSLPLEERIAEKVEEEVEAIFPDRKKRGSRTSASTGSRAVKRGSGPARTSC